MAGEKDTWLSRNAGRLLRQNWKSPYALAQELYAIVSDVSEGPASAAPPPEVAARKPASAPARTQPTPAQKSSGDAAAIRAGGTPVDLAAALAPGGPPVTKLGGPGLDFKPAPGADTGGFPLGWPPAREQPYKADNLIKDWDWPFSLPGVGGGNTLQGQVTTAVSGPDIQVKLYPNGSTEAAGSTVTVHILQLASTETIPAGTWIVGINQFTHTGDSDEGGTPTIFYEAQVPIWLA